MDSKTWLWRKKSSEKTIVTTNKFSFYVKGIDEEIEKLPTGNGIRPVGPVRSLNEKLASVLLDTQAKDDFVTEKAKLAPEAIAGHEKAAQAEIDCLKQELDKASRHGAAETEKSADSDNALKQCMQKFSTFQEEQEQKIQHAVMKASSEFENVQKKLEEKLVETSKRLANLAIENTNMNKALIVKEKLIEELHKRVSQTAAEFNALLARLDSTEKENSFLKYEFHMLEKELEVRSEELEYNRRSADASLRQHLESVKKITKLEAECQRLRVLMRKRLPTSSAFAKIKGEVEMLGRDQAELRRKPNPTTDLIIRDNTKEKSPDIHIENINFLLERLRGMEEENKTLKDVMAKKNAELQSSRTMFSRTASRLSQVESQLIELSGGHNSMELSKCSPVPNEFALGAGFNNSSDDGVGASGSWANALISELEHFKDWKLKSQLERNVIEDSDMSLMDDFLEMEKLALVSVETPSGIENHLPSSSLELVPVEQVESSCDDRTQEIHSKDISSDKSFDWIQEVLSVIHKQQKISKRRPVELLEDIKIALGCINQTNTNEADTTEFSSPPPESDIRGYIAWKSPKTTLIADSVNESPNVDSSVKETSKQCSQTKLSKSISKIIELIEGIKLPPPISNHSSDDGLKMHQYSSLSAKPVDYFVHVFQWKSSELNAVLQQFICTCNRLLNGKEALDDFAEKLLFTLDWILSNYVSPKDYSSASDGIKKHFGWNDMVSKNDIGIAVDLPLVELAISNSKEQSSCFHSVAASHNQNPKEIFHNNMEEGNKNLKCEPKFISPAKNDVEATLQSATDDTKALMMPPWEQEQSVEDLKAELETLKESKGMIEDQLENQKLINEDLDTQLTVAKAKLNEVLQKFSSLEVELEDKSNCCDELEATCLELQLELESMAKKETVNCTANNEGRQPQNGWEITEASVKLAECQETILNLGKQLKALATPREAAIFDKVFSTSNEARTAIKNKNLIKHFSLRDQMLAEDSAKAIILRPPTKDAQKPSLNNSDTDNGFSNSNIQEATPKEFLGSKHRTGNTAVGTLAIVPSKKQGAGFLRRLLMRKKKGGSKKSRFVGKV